MARLDGLGEFERLCLRLLPKIQKLIFERSGDPQLAEEVAHETLLQAYRSRHTFDASRPMLPWLIKIAVRIYARERSKRVQTVPIDLLDERDFDSALLSNPNPEAKVLDAEGEFLWSLRLRYRRALLYKYVLHLGYDEIGKLEGVSHNGVTSLLRRARESFRRTVEAARSQIQTLLWFPVRTAEARLRARATRIQHIAESITAYSFVTGIGTAIGLIAIGVVAMTTATLPSRSFSSIAEYSTRAGAKNKGSSRIFLATGVHSSSVSASAQAGNSSHIPTGSIAAEISTSDLSPAKPPANVRGSFGTRDGAGIGIRKKISIQLGDREETVSNGTLLWLNCDPHFVPHRVVCATYDDILVPQTSPWMSD